MPFRQLQHVAKFTFVLFRAQFLSPLPHSLVTICGKFWCKTRVSAELAGALLTLFFAWNVAQHVRKARSETKCSDTP